MGGFEIKRLKMASEIKPPWCQALKNGIRDQTSVVPVLERVTLVTDINRRICRERLRKELLLPDKIPADHEATYYNVSVYSDSWIKEPWGQVSVQVYAAAAEGSTHPNGLRRKSSTHRVFVKCGCGCLVPAGRFHQHAPACSSAPAASVLALWERIKGMREYGRSWEECQRWLKIPEPWVIWEVMSQLGDADKQGLRDGTVDFAELVMKAH